MLIDYKDFIIGAMSVVMVYVFFKDNPLWDVEQEEDEFEDDDEGILNYHDNDFGRTVILSCQTCRKQKKHREIEHNLYQCVKCKRHVDLRRKSS